MKIHWRRSAVDSLISLDKWRREIELRPMAAFLRRYINEYFQRQDFSIYIPGKDVVIEGYPINLKLLLLSIGKSGPYKVFYRLEKDEIEILLVRHPRQNEI
ncbi:hypothetical protein DEAC_c08280 [Desulfosporosinus acididurans]|uniref:Plasmid stabilization system protein n=1 Tax=Desulfosporosinus acididurans TaxID=476652 RepID=A0A0J1FTV1_9FIRM|nr:hypothetical protein [Desulfosporosinus acididurans]KLU66894.1 hypothetical protein DEAC_c08280 [Desulfosporosinus acididurans]